MAPESWARCRGVHSVQRPERSSMQLTSMMKLKMENPMV